MARRGRPPLKKELTLKGLPEIDINVIKRLIRVKGQADGLMRMVAEEKDLIEIIYLFKALKAAINQAGRVYITYYLSKSIRKGRNSAEARRLMRKLIKEIARY
jgi:DNA-binding FrmR family transcriptional regulator